MPVAVGRRNVVKVPRVQAVGNDQPVIGDGPRTVSGKRPTAAALRLEREYLDWSAVPPSRDDVVQDYDAFMAERGRLAAAEAGNPGKEEAHAIAAPASTAPASAAIPPLPPAHGEPLNRYALDPDGAPCRTSPSVELHAALVSAQIQAELEAGQHVYAKQWARPAVQWGGVQWDRSLEIAIAAELSQPSRRRTAASQGTRRTLTSPATWSRARRGRRPAIARQPFPFSAGEASDYEGHARCDF